MIVYDKAYLEHNLEGHPENKERLIKIVELLKRKEVFDKVPLIAPKKAEEEDLLRVHTHSHIEKMRELSNSSSTVLGDTYHNAQTFETALLAVGGVIKCIESKHKRSFALVRPPGHHATVDASMGFCIFNNVAVGASFARDNGYEKIAILDFDLHHGNGTQDIFYNDDILYLSLHQYPHYPGTGATHEVGSGKGEGFTVNVPLPPGTSDKSYETALKELVYPVLIDFSPDLLVLSAGYDGHFSDPLGNLLLTTELYNGISRKAKELSKKTIFSLEGGYNLESLPHCVYSSLQGLFDLEREEYENKVEEEVQLTQEMGKRTAAIKKQVSDYWNI
jgi:acetoin utilization deacetylase AcuC-like enzyme